MDVHPNHIRAARALMGITQEGLARLAKTSARSVVMVEQGTAAGSMHWQIVGCLVSHGITFIETERLGRLHVGVRYQRKEPPPMESLGEAALEGIRSADALFRRRAAEARERRGPATG